MIGLFPMVNRYQREGVFAGKIVGYLKGVAEGRNLSPILQKFTPEKKYPGKS